MNPEHVTHKVRALCTLDVPLFGQTDDVVSLDPPVIAAKWTRNSATKPDEITLTLDWSSAGIDPRMLKNGRVLFWLYDAALEDLDVSKHLRFAGIVTSAEREQDEDSSRVEIKAEDFTILFLEQKAMPQSGVPSWTDTLSQAWERICDNTGYWSRDEGRVISSVGALRDRLVIVNPEDAALAIGECVPKRMHAISKPSFGGPRASSWKVWTSIVAALGLHTFIDRDQCIVVRPSELYSADNAPAFVYGKNVLGIKEHVDTAKTTKGVLLQSFDPLTGRVLEAFYPPPGDPRIKAKRSAAGAKSEGGTANTANEVSGEDYQPYDYHWITDQKTLDARAREAYEESSRQELEGTFRTAETTCHHDDNAVTSIFDLRAGDAVSVRWDHFAEDEIRKWTPNDRRIHFQELGYSDETAAFLAANIERTTNLKPVFNVKSVSVDYGPERFEVEIGYHNRIELG